MLAVDSSYNQEKGNPPISRTKGFCIILIVVIRTKVPSRERPLVPPPPTLADQGKVPRGRGRGRKPQKKKKFQVQVRVMAQSGPPYPTICIWLILFPNHHFVGTSGDPLNCLSARRESIKSPQGGDKPPHPPRMGAPLIPCVCPANVVGQLGAEGSDQKIGGTRFFLKRLGTPGRVPKGLCGPRGSH